MMIASRKFLSSGHMRPRREVCWKEISWFSDQTFTRIFQTSSAEDSAVVMSNVMQDIVYIYVHEGQESSAYSRLGYHYNTNANPNAYRSLYPIIQHRCVLHGVVSYSPIVHGAVSCFHSLRNMQIEGPMASLCSDRLLPKLRSLFSFACS